MIGVGDFRANELMLVGVADVLDTGRISYGPYSKRFEESVAQLHGNSFGVLANSGTSALLVALQTLKELHGWEDGDEVIVPASTFVATVNIVIQCNLKPVLVDVDPNNYLLAIDHIPSVITERTRAIIPVHLFGQPVDMKYLRSMADGYDLVLLEDSCESCGIEGIGLADITCFSFYVAHILTTGVGGMAITNNNEYAVRMRSLVNHGRDNIYISIDDNNHDRLAEVIGKRFQFHHMGHSFRITELESAIGLAQVPLLPIWLKARLFNAVFLTEALIYRGLGTHLQLPGSVGEHAWMMYPLVCQDQETKIALCRYLEEHGIETRDALPLVTQPVYSDWIKPTNYPNAYRLATCGFYVGCHQYLNPNDMGAISQAIGDFYATLG